MPLCTAESHVEGRRSMIRVRAVVKEDPNNGPRRVGLATGWIQAEARVAQGGITLHVAAVGIRTSSEDCRDQRTEQTALE